MKSNYPVIDIAGTGRNIKRIMQLRGLTVRDVQTFLELGTPQSIYHWFDGRNLPTVDNLYALSELFRLPVDELLVGNRRYENWYESDIYRRVLIYNAELSIMRAKARISPCC